MQKRIIKAKRVTEEETTDLRAGTATEADPAVAVSTGPKVETMTIRIERGNKIDKETTTEREARKERTEVVAGKREPTTKQGQTIQAQTGQQTETEETEVIAKTKDCME